MICKTNAVFGSNKLKSLVDRTITEVSAGDLDGATNIGAYVFRDCTSLISAVIPDSVKHIGNYAFYGCNSLTRVKFDDAKYWYVTTIESDWQNKENGTRVSVSSASSSATYLKSTYYYYYWYKLDESQGLNYSLGGDNGSYYYLGQENMSYSGSSLVIPNIYNNKPVKEIGNWAFTNCSSIKTLVVPDNVESIGEQAFEGCTNLTVVDLGTDTAYNTVSNLTSIGLSAFSGCNKLKSIVIPANVQSIGAGAFYGCTNLTSIRLLKSTPPEITSSTFPRNSNLEIIVPKGCKNYYNSGNWLDYTIVEAAE